jgi:hypothetical protein
METVRAKEDAQSLAALIIENHPESMKTRPFMKWMLVKAAESGFKEKGSLAKEPHKSFEYLESFLDNYPGISYNLRTWTWLPIYFPLGLEIPSWQIPELDHGANDPIHMALTLATQRQDYVTQVLCLKLLISRSQDPTKLYERLGHLQKSVQQDRDEYLHTCLSSYLICEDTTSQKRLLAELREFDDWTESWAYLPRETMHREGFILKDQ